MQRPDWASEGEWENLDVVRYHIGREAWAVRDIDPLASGVAYVFYVRTKRMQEYINILGEKMIAMSFDANVCVPAELVKEQPGRAAEYIMYEAQQSLKNARVKSV